MGISSIRRFTGQTSCTDLPPFFSSPPCLPSPWRTPLTLLLPRLSSRPRLTRPPPESTSPSPPSTTTFRPSRSPPPTLLTPRMLLLPRLSSRLLSTMLLPEDLLPSRPPLPSTLWPPLLSTLALSPPTPPTPTLLLPTPTLPTPTPPTRTPTPWWLPPT